MPYDQWKAGESCGLHCQGWCSLCKPHPHLPEFVYMTTGWSAAFHESVTCNGLVSGQKMVARRGGDPADVVRVPVNKPIADGKFPCQTCWPQFRGIVPPTD